MAGAGGGDVQMATPADEGLPKVESYISAYETSGVKIQRLLHIFEHIPNLAHEAGTIALAEMQKLGRVHQYSELHMKMASRGWKVPLDERWVDATKEEQQLLRSDLEVQLGMAKTGADKGKALRSLTHLGDLYYKKGDLGQSIRYYIRSREYCQSPKDILSMCLSVILSCIEHKAVETVTQHVTSAERNGDAGKDKVSLGMVRVASALMLLETRKYRAAAKKLLEIPHELGTNYSQVVSPGDIAVMAGLLAMATFDRNELKTNVLDNNNFRNFLEYAPDMQDILRDFYNSKYACLKVLEGMKDKLLLDFFLFPHVSTLLEQTWQRAVKRYTSPFLTVDMSKMAVAFNTQITSLEESVAKLIADRQINARIDSAEKVLYARRDNLRQATFVKALEASEKFLAETEGKLRRINMIHNNFCHRGTGQRTVEQERSTS
eukprot:Sspe_Gene.101188::Locus_75782_Transcript_1_1_Confidence_1.000_Length_1410::g.101188::m.101188/K12175/GPS1, COPS1, CSN1; COP9 signalosome complex subunit 1